MLNVLCKRSKVGSGFARVTMIFQHKIYNGDQTYKYKDIVQESHETPRFITALRRYWKRIESVTMRRAPRVIVPSTAAFHLSALSP